MEKEVETIEKICAHQMNVTTGNTTEDRCDICDIDKLLIENGVKLKRKSYNGAPLCQFPDSQESCPCFSSYRRISVINE